MNHTALVQKLADGATIKDLSIEHRKNCRYFERKVATLKERTFSKTIAQLVAYYIRKELIK